MVQTPDPGPPDGQQPAEGDVPPLRLVVGYDGSAAAVDALRTAAGLARGDRGELYVVVVGRVHPLADISLDAALTDATNAEEQAAVVQADLANRLDDSGIAWSFERREGDVAGELAAVAEEVAADLIVLGRSRAAFPRSVLGSVPASLTRHAPRPVLVVP